MEQDKDQPIWVMDQLSLGEFVVRSAVCLVNLDAGTQMPNSWGTGFILRYRERHFLVTVYHVIQVDPDNVYIEMGKDETGHVKLQQINGFYWFSKIVVNNSDKPENLIQKIENPEKF